MRCTKGIVLFREHNPFISLFGLFSKANWMRPTQKVKRCRLPAVRRRKRRRAQLAVMRGKSQTIQTSCGAFAGNPMVTGRVSAVLNGTVRFLFLLFQYSKAR